MNVVVVGGGKMGLPLACVMADHGAQVTVADLDPTRVEAINEGKAPFHEPGLAEYLSRTVARDRLQATTDTTAAARQADAIIVLVPAVLTDEADIDYSNLRNVSEAIARGLGKKTVVSYETTVPVGGVRSELVPVLESKSGLKAGADFYVCFSPERVKSGYVMERLSQTPKIVGGLNPESAKRGEALYRTYLKVEVHNVGSLEAAEFAKLAGMLYRDVNIALTNELAAFCEAIGLDYGKIIDVSNSNGEAHLLLPGIGVGGHCTPVYPYFVIQQAKRMGFDLRLPAIGRAINEDQPQRNVNRLKQALGSLKGKKCHILGLGFRPGVKEHIYSPAFKLQELLKAEGVHVTLEDPYYTAAELEQLGFFFAQVETLSCEMVVLNTAHEAFLRPNFPSWKSNGVELVLDGRNVWNPRDVQMNGIAYLGIGQEAI